MLASYGPGLDNEELIQLDADCAEPEEDTSDVNKPNLSTKCLPKAFSLMHEALSILEANDPDSERSSNLKLMISGNIN